MNYYDQNHTLLNEQASSSPLVDVMLHYQRDFSANMMTMIRISKEFSFEMAHALSSYDGKCAGLHGHSYHLTVTVLGSVNNDGTDPRQGMVMDFSELKGIVKKHVVDILDHAVVLNAKDPLSRQINSGPTKLFITQYQPTSENLLIDFAARIRAALPPPAELHSLKLRETSTSYAEWFAADNP